MFQKIVAQLLNGKGYREMKTETNDLFISFCELVSNALRDVRIKVGKDENMTYLSEMQEDGFIETEGFIYALWFYKNNGIWGQEFGELWLHEIRNTYQKKLTSQGVPKLTLKKLLEHVEVRCSEYDSSPDNTQLLQENILQKHRIKGIDLLAGENSSKQAQEIQGYIKLFVKKLDKNLDIFIKK